MVIYIFKYIAVQKKLMVSWVSNHLFRNLNKCFLDFTMFGTGFHSEHLVVGTCDLTHATAAG